MDEKWVLDFIRDWAEKFFRNKDVIARKIVDIKHTGSGLVVQYKEIELKVEVASILNYLQEPSFEKNTAIVTLNNRKNVETLYAKWSQLRNIHNLKIYFINPYSTTDTKWVIDPNIHSKICDGASLKTGLTAMFGTVEPLTIELLKTHMKGTV